MNLRTYVWNVRSVLLILHFSTSAVFFGRRAVLQECRPVRHFSFKGPKSLTPEMFKYQSVCTQNIRIENTTAYS